MKKFLLPLALLLVVAAAIAAYAFLWPDPKPVLADPDCPPGAPVMAFDLYGDLRQDDVAVLHENGDVKRLTKDHASFEPTFSPDGSEIAYTNGSEGLWGECCGFDEHRIYIMNSDGTDQRRLVPGEHFDDEPDWSPDGGEIAFVRDNTDLMVVDASGQDARLVYRHDVEVSDPTWSPDGERIAFSMGEDGGDNFGIIDADGGEPEILVEEIGGEDLAWSPDGQTFAFNAHPGIMTATLEEPNPRAFARGGYSPAFSPDGRHIAYFFTGDDEQFRPRLVTQPVGGGDQVPIPADKKNLYSFATDLDWLNCS